jgi:arginine/ornithine transport system permease protein
MHAYYLSILHASLLTIAVSLASLAVAVVFGLLGAAARLSQGRLASAAGAVYTTVVRGIPDLVMMLLVFYGGTMGLNRPDGSAGPQGLGGHQPLYRRGAARWASSTALT